MDAGGIRLKRLLSRGSLVRIQHGSFFSTGNWEPWPVPSAAFFAVPVSVLPSGKDARIAYVDACAAKDSSRAGGIARRGSCGGGRREDTDQ